MTGTLALIGGGEFRLTEDLDRRLLAASGGTEVLILPTADAFEHPQRAVDAAVAWFAQLGATASGLHVLRRVDAQEDRHAATVAAARFVYLVGDNPLHLRSVLKDTLVWEALTSVLAAGGVVAAAGASAAALCDPMVDSRGGAFTLGLALVPGLALVTSSDTWSPERLKRTKDLVRGFALATMPSGSALLATGGAWETIGDVGVVGGALPPFTTP